MASTTKIMTALVAMELYDIHAWVEIRPEWTGIEGSSMYLKSGEKMQIIDLLYGLLLMSGNDAAEALAGIWTGNREDFIAVMNRKAEMLGLSDTAFVNPHGLEAEGHYSTALDLARLMAVAMTNEVFREITGTASCQRAGRYMRNHNKLLTLYNGCIGGKTGYTRKAGRCLVTAAEQQGRMLIAVTLQAPDDWSDHTILYDAAFSDMEQVQIFQRGIVGRIAVAGGGNCPLYAEADYSIALLSGEARNTFVDIHGPRLVYRPVKAGEQYGYLNVRLGEQVVFTTPLYYENEIPATVKASVWSMIRQWLRDR